MINPSCPDYLNTPVSQLRPRMDYLPSDPHATPWVTVITPFYNTQEVFHETAQSVFRQSLQQWEWIIINDGSQNPESLAVLDQYRQKDPRIRVIDHPQNKGPGAARNTGFREARADFVFQLDSDDLIEPTTLEKMAWYLFTHPDAAFVDGHKVGFGTEQYLWTRGFYCGKEFLDENLATVTCMIRKSSHAAVGGYDEENKAGMEDWDFWLKVANNGQWGGTIPEFFDWYRRRTKYREHWSNILQKNRFTEFHRGMKNRYAGLWQTFPEPPAQYHPPCQPISKALPGDNLLTKNKHRIFCIFPHLEIGGADKFNLDLIKLLITKHGYEVTIVTTLPAANQWMHLFLKLTPDVFILPNFVPLYDCPRVIRYLIASRKSDVVLVSNSALGYQLLPYIRSHFPAITIVDFIHMEEEYWRAGGYPRYSVNYQSQIDLTIVSSEHLKQWLIARGADASRIEVSYTNCDPELWSRRRFNAEQLRNKWNVRSDSPVILFAGRVCEQKQPKVLAEVMLRVAQKNAPFQVVIAGDGPLLSWLKAFVQQKKLEQVSVLGAVSNEAVAELLAISDIFFLPSQMEGIALVLFEAMAMEVVPVGADVGGQRELVTPDCGVLLQPDSHQADRYVAALCDLLVSSEKRKRMANQARDRILKHFVLEQMGVRMTELISHARCFARQQPRSTLPVDLAGSIAAEAVEQTRLHRILEGGWRGPNGSTKRVQLDNNRFTQVFLCRNGKHSEETSLQYELFDSPTCMLRIELLDGLGDGALRIDPINFPGIISIQHIRVCRFDTEDVIWSTENIGSLNLVRVGGTAARIGKGKKLCVLSYGNDPWLLLPRIPAPANTALFLDLHFELLNPAEFAAANGKLIAIKEPVVRKALRTISSLPARMSKGISQMRKT